MFKLFCKMIIALAFVPISSLNDSFDSLVAEFPEELQDQLQDVTDWFEDYYLGRMQRNNRRRRAMFPANLWFVFKTVNFYELLRNLHERVLAGVDQTNNFAEAAHKRMQKELCVDHPTIWRFIDGLKAAQATQDKEYEEFVVGRSQSQKRSKYREADERIQSIVEGGFGEGGERTIIEYLRGLAQNFSMDN